ncbi:unnamed protein product [Cyprideis torosa]|uniref:Uncharacterized protein n=1 Tax=Cyprideis torosa TaxID=163714 RepID=A0A7R8W128_9CRUS|nr:unnamed protein product [Cyprideis torosa]CAG0880444.1 unnamed protein product [Cyprideis torosa]
MTNPGLRVYGVSAGPHYPSYLYYQGPPNYNVGFSNYGSLRIRPNNPLYSSPYKRPRPRTYNRPSLLRTESEDPDYPLFKTNEHLYHPFFRVDREGRTFGIFKDLFGLFPPPQEQFVEQNGVPEPLWLAEEQGPAIMDSFRLTVPFYPFVRDPPVPNSNRLGSLNEAVNAMPATELEQVVHRIIASMDSANNNNAFYPNRGRYYFY